MADLRDAQHDLNMLKQRAIVEFRREVAGLGNKLARGLSGAVHRRSGRLRRSFKSETQTQVDGSFNVRITGDKIYTYAHLAHLNKPHLALERQLIRDIENLNNKRLDG